MSTATATLGEVEVLRHSFRTTQQVLRMNLQDITHEESLVPPPAGNCLNWIVGHLLCVYNEVLPFVGQQPVMPKELLQRYGRGTPPLQDAREALPLSDMLASCEEAANRFDAGLASLTPERLDAPAPFSPSQNPKETVRSLLTLVAFHQAYHVGQTGIMRRIVGKPRAIA